MDKKIMSAVLLAFCLIWLGWGIVWSGWNGQIPAQTINGWENNRLIAHALGGIQGSSYTNSYDAFITNYNKGYRLFETDLLLTTDGELAARHDWSKRLQPDLSGQTGHSLTSSQFESSLIDGKFRPLLFKDILHLMVKYPDFYLITDTKEMNKQKIQQQFSTLVEQARKVDASLLNRIIPEIYSPEMYDTVMNIYPFPNKIYSLYQSGASAASIVNFVKEKQISVVAMPTYRVLINPNLVYALNQLNVQSYVHTVNNPGVMKLMSQLGVHGYYTDLETPPNTLEDTFSKPAKLVFGKYIQEVLGTISSIIMKVAT
ncbi:phosphatidylinositol-specific phospholipase C/glycerophosphodiester phosphodiesterase family protein [Paenibacillus sp. GCM10012306]|uniref:phosphatidylinositol-specific phospholipase C/glycerophosphodiester phosphodiesterase family protein n=1 Tax=Paenibacillus sp. GCM10012306 TaxID=3317342 RepID=UPI003606BE4A